MLKMSSKYYATYLFLLFTFFESFFIILVNTNVSLQSCYSNKFQFHYTFHNFSGPKILFYLIILLLFTDDYIFLLCISVLDFSCTDIHVGSYCVQVTSLSSARDQFHNSEASVADCKYLWCRLQLYLHYDLVESKLLV